MDDPGFWWEFVGKVGAPIFAATLVAFLLSSEFELLHGALMATGLGMMVVCHWRSPLKMHSSFLLFATCLSIILFLKIRFKSSRGSWKLTPERLQNNLF